MDASWLAINPKKKKKAPSTIASMAPTLTPRPASTMGIPHRKPTAIQEIESGRKIRRGLTSMARFRISMIVWNAVWVPMELDPAIRFLTEMGNSSTRCPWLRNNRVITSLKAMESGHRDR